MSGRGAYSASMGLDLECLQRTCAGRGGDSNQKRLEGRVIKKNVYISCCSNAINVFMVGLESKISPKCIS